MKKLIPWTIALITLWGHALLGQSLVGTWQGTLGVPQVPRGELRTVFKLSTTDSDTLKAVMYSIDQGGQPVSATSVSVQGSAVKIAIAGIGGAFEGKLSADGNTIAGTWSQGPMPLTLNLTRATAQTAWAIPEPPARPKPMAADANPAFEVATIKPSRPEAVGKGINVNGHQITTRNTSVSDLITFAYGVHGRQVTGGPSWIDTEKYDLQAEPDVAGAPNDRQVKMMFQKMLADRFQLTFHRDKKELTVYTLNVGKTGPKLNKSDSDPNGLPTLGLRGLGRLFTRNASMADFAALMQTTALDRPVVDQTGLTGKYDFTLDWTPDESQFGGRGRQAAPPVDNAEVPPDLYTAIQQQLGLKLESTRAPVEVIVIERLEKPSAN
jgi:uncharacterized protein (TIGR03435 family)